MVSTHLLILLPERHCFTFVFNFTISSFMFLLLISEIYVACESCNCVFSLMLGQPDKVRNGSSNVIEFLHHGLEPDSEPGGGGAGRHLLGLTA